MHLAQNIVLSTHLKLDFSSSKSDLTSLKTTHQNTVYSSMNHAAKLKGRTIKFYSHLTASAIITTDIVNVASLAFNNKPVQYQSGNYTSFCLLVIRRPFNHCETGHCIRDFI